MEESGYEPEVERVVPLYNKTDVIVLREQTFLRDKFVVWASNGSCVEDIWNNLKNIVYECIERFVPRTSKILRKIWILNITRRKLNDKNQRSEKHIMEEN